jgi:two-component system sensor histidine kinase ChiS
MSRAKVLICEDDPSLRELMRLALGDYAFAEAADVGETIELVQQFRPDLLLLDVMMPGGSGLDVLAKLRLDQELAETPVLIVSAFTSDADQRAAHDAGANQFLAKPFDPDQLAATVRDLLAAHPRAA